MTSALGLFNYSASLFLILFGIFTMMAVHHLIRKVIGMVILQTGVILFFVSLSVKRGAAIPILDPDAAHAALDIAQYANPLPHALMLTAIVVGVGTLGVALTLIVSIYRSFGTLEEDEVIQQLKEDAC